MPRLVFTTFPLVLLLVLVNLSHAAQRKAVNFVQLDSAVVADKKEIRVQPDTMFMELCPVNPLDRMVWRVEGWVTGSELYKNFLDPSKSCDDPYPYTITQVNMPMYFSAPTSVYVSVDIEDVYYSSPECPWPDSVLAISSDYQIYIPEAGLYDLWIPLDQPLTVNGPFFAGFFIGNEVDSAAGVSVVTNNDPEVACRSYNIWDEQFGFVDLVNNGVWKFPGQLCLYVSGHAGGKDIKTQPAPDVKILSPADGNQVFGKTDIWAKECSGSKIIDYMTFEYSSSGEFIEIGHDFDGTMPRRDGLSDAESGDGYSHLWNFASLEEGYYTLRVTAYDTLGRSASDEVRVYLEPTPPTPCIVSPRGCSEFCSSIDVLVTCPDDDLTQIRMYHKEAKSEYSAGIQPLSQHNYGDGNGDPSDGNLKTNGEFGDYYSGPVAAAMAIQSLVHRGYSSLVSVEQGAGWTDSLVEDLAAHFHTRANAGTCDDDLYRGLLEHSQEHGSSLKVAIDRNPCYSTIRTRLEDEEQAVLLALGGSPSVWLAVDGFSGWTDDDGYYSMVVCDPLSGGKALCLVRNTQTGAMLKLNDKWHSIDLLVSVGVVSWDVKRDLVDEDSDESDGWSMTWTPEELSPSSCHFVRVEGIDDKGMKDYNTIVLNHNCSNFHTAGDYDGDGTANILDLAYLADYIGDQGPEPIGGSFRADTNGDSHINVTDLVYYVNYLYGEADLPCH